jgi:quercetin dioxygenase-like cupin family protein
MPTDEPQLSAPTDLHALGAQLFASSAESHDGGRAATTVLHEPGLRATLIALRAGHELAEHAAPPAASLFVVSGEVRLTSSTNATALTAGQLIAIPHERHSLIADSDAVVLLTVRFE